MNMETTVKPARLRGDRVTMAHGGGGKAMADLIAEIFTEVFQPPGHEDQARLTSDALAEPGARLAFTTDSFVVSPPEFPGGDIGKIAVCGTVNDLAVGGAKPLWLSAAFIIEEGCEFDLLRRIVASMQAEAEKAGVRAPILTLSLEAQSLEVKAGVRAPILTLSLEAQSLAVKAGVRAPILTSSLLVQSWVVKAGVRAPILTIFKFLRVFSISRLNREGDFHFETKRVHLSPSAIEATTPPISIKERETLNLRPKSPKALKKRKN